MLASRPVSEVSRWRSPFGALKLFLIAYQDEPGVEVWRREPDSGWAFEARDLGGAIDLPELGGRLAVAEIYDDIAF